MLAKGGVFIHEIDQLDPAVMRLGPTDLPRFTILGRSAPISTTAYLRSHGIGIHRGNLAQKPESVFATHRKQGRALELGLVFDPVSMVVLKTLPARSDGSVSWGVRSVYRLGEANV